MKPMGPQAHDVQKMCGGYGAEKQQQAQHGEKQVGHRCHLALSQVGLSASGPQIGRLIGLDKLKFCKAASTPEKSTGPRSLSNRLMGRLGRLALHGFGVRRVPLGFNGCRLAVARVDQFLLELRLLVGRHHFAGRRQIFYRWVSCRLYQ